MGGMTAAVVASQIGSALGGVILADPTFLSPQRQREVYESDAVEQHRRLLTLDKEEVLSQARLRHAHRRPEFIELVTEARMKTRIGAFDVLTPPNPEYHRLVSAIDLPILLVIADHGVVSLETAQELQNLNPRLRVEQIQDAGHGLHYDQPERFEAVVRAFLQSMAAS
jgi:pimeloyl-ACP methyl ester carboxylesterase